MHGDLTHSQLQIWIGQRLNPSSPLYNMAFAWILPADLDPGIFRQAWRRVAESSDALSTRITQRDGVAVRQQANPCLTRVQAQEPRTGMDPGRQFSRWCQERCSRPLDLEAGLVDSVLVRLDDGRIGWYLNQHHLITDAWSTVLLYRWVAAEYAALHRGDDRPSLPPDYYPTATALAQAQPAAAEEHWASRSEHSRSIPFYGRTAEPVGTASTRMTLTLDEARTQALDALSAESGFLSFSREMSRFALFATLLLAWLHRVSGRFDLGFDAPVAGRPTSESKRALGLFIEMFPFAVNLGPEETFRSLGAKCLEEAGLFLSHALPGTSAPSGTHSGNVVLNYFPESFGDFAGLPADVEWVHPGHGDSVHALRLQVHDFGGTGRITLHFDFNDSVLPRRLRHRGLRHFDKLLAAMLDDPDARIARVDVLTADERDALATLNATAAAPLPDRTVVARFREQAQANPEHVALRQGSTEKTFGRLLEESDALAATLIGAGVKPGDRVAILCQRDVQAVVAILAVLRVRAAYVTIDPAYPTGRRQDILKDCGARVLLTGDAPSEITPDGPDGISVIQISQGISAGHGVSLDREGPTLDDLAYVLYTSGSTGRPKGVLIEHGGLADYLTWAQSEYVRGERLSFPLFTSLSFDLTVTSLFLPLITGGELRIYPEPDGPVDSAIFDVATDDAVDFIKLTPSHLSLLVQMRPAPSRIRRMVVGGEDFKTALAAEVVELLGDGVEITNEYGPTEAVVGCVAHRYSPQADTGPRVPIGAPADHVRVEILNHALTPVPEGVPGELWISRYGLARGYLGLEELSAERFLEGAEQRGQRRYRTGDRVRMIDAERLEYLGRLDRQLKLSGHRIEPAEIEAALLSVPAVEQCVVVARRPDPPAASDDLRHCTRCGLASNHPRTTFDRQGVCNVCRSYEQIKEHARGYFKTMDDLRDLFAVSAKNKSSDSKSSAYDCMMLLSGGKDSTYALCRLVDLGLSVYAFTLDNGFISDGAKANIRRVTEQLGVPVEFGTTPAMNAIFRDSLNRFANVCQGCFKTIYTLSTNRARELGIPIIVTGLSRGQMFETRLNEDMFSGGRRTAEEIDAAVLAARKVYHRLDDEVARSLDVEIFRDDRLFDEIQYVDFYRYCDVGIYVHKQQMGYHNYALPYSWDVRMGHKTRDEALDELDDEIDTGYVRRTLAEIGADAEGLADTATPRLAAYYVAGEVTEDEIRERIAERLPRPLIPTHLKRVDQIPLTAHGKVDEQALPAIELARPLDAHYRPPDGPVEEYLASVWQEHLGIERVGGDDSFFRLGGTSLGGMEVMIRLCSEFDIELPLETLFQHPTLSALARVAEDRILADVEDLSDAERAEVMSSSLEDGS